eukprot:m51a1_g12121 putative rhs repeat-associated core domain-containing protein (395) ;mRNA; f:1046-4125
MACHIMLWRVIAIDQKQRNCDCIASYVEAQHVARWGDCKYTSDSDYNTAKGEPLYCRIGDRRCLRDDDCRWAILIDKTNRDCELVIDNCLNGYIDYKLGESDTDCGGECPNTRADDPLRQERMFLCDMMRSTDVADVWGYNPDPCERQDPCRGHRGIACTGGRITEINIENMRLEGTIPSSIVNCGRLRELRLRGNRLSGTIPSGLFSLPHLTYLNLMDNHLTGTLPSTEAPVQKPFQIDISNLVNMTYISIEKNRISGTIPSSISSLRYLRTLWAPDNLLDGKIPASWGDRRCMSMNTCRWARKKDKVNRNCDCIAPCVDAGHVPNWGDCKLTSDCDDHPVRGQALYCRKGDKRCLRDDDCKWANKVDKTNRDCSRVIDHCFNVPKSVELQKG